MNAKRQKTGQYTHTRILRTLSSVCNFIDVLTDAMDEQATKSALRVLSPTLSACPSVNVELISASSESFCTAGRQSDWECEQFVKMSKIWKNTDVIFIWMSNFPIFLQFFSNYRYFAKYSRIFQFFSIFSTFCEFLDILFTIFHFFLITVIFPNSRKLEMRKKNSRLAYELFVVALPFVRLSIVPSAQKLSLEEDKSHHIYGRTGRRPKWDLCTCATKSNAWFYHAQPQLS